MQPEALLIVTNATTRSALETPPSETNPRCRCFESSSKMSEFQPDSSSQDVKYLKNQLNIARNEINNLRQQLKTLTHAHKKDCDDIVRKLENWRCLECRNRQMSMENCGASSQSQQVDLPLQYIGVIHTHFPEKRGTPRQPGICSNTIAKLTLNNVFTNPEHALEGLQEYSHMWIIFHFHKNDSTHTRAKVAPPRLNGLRTGVFATRSPHRPCPIGLSLVKIDRIMENTIYFSGVDMIDQTPVIDIKPYIPKYDNPTVLPLENDAYNSSFSDLNVSYEENNVSLDNSAMNDLSSHERHEANFSLDNLNIRTMDGEENNSRTRNHNVIGNNSLPQLNLNSNHEENYIRVSQRMGEREAPDGEEEESPRQQTGAVGFGNTSTTPEGQVRIPSWIDNPPVSTLTVLFKDLALAQLSQLGSETNEKKAIITNVLKEDPRSVYLRERLGSHCYVFRIADLNVSCKFNDAAHTVTVFKVFQNSVTDSDE